jgi:AraC-like DNA-binding protein
VTPAKSQDSEKLAQLFQQVKESFVKDLKQADSLNQEFKKLIAEQNPPHDSILIRAHFLDALLNLYKGRYFLAEKYFNDILAMASGFESNLIKEVCYNNLGVIYHKKNLLSKAFDANLKSIRLAELRKDSNSIIQSYINLSLIESDRKNLAEAIDIGKKVLDYSYRHGDTLGMALGHQNLGVFYYLEHAFEKADIENAKALALYKSLGVLYDRYVLQMNMADGMRERRKYAEALKIVEEVLPGIGRKGYEGLMIQANFLRGQIAMDGYRHFDDAERYLRAAERLSKEFGEEKYLPDIYENIAKLGMITQRREIFEDAFQQFKTYHEQKFSVESVTAYEEMKVLYELEKEKEKQAALRIKMELRNKQFFYTIAVLLILLAASALLYNQHLRLKNAFNALFRLNLEQSRAKPQPTPEKTSQQESAIEKKTESPADTHVEVFQEIIAFLETDKRFQNQDLELHRVATSLNMSSKEANWVIRNHAGTNFSGLLTKLRIQEARRLMLKPDLTMTIKEIAVEVGFNNPYSFYRQFKEVTGFSPSEFKELADKDMEKPASKEEVG